MPDIKTMENAIHEFYYEGDIERVIKLTDFTREQAIRLLYEFGIQHEGQYVPDADECVDRWEECSLF